MITLKKSHKISIFFTNIANYITREVVFPEFITTWKTVLYQYKQGEIKMINALYQTFLSLHHDRRERRET